MKLWTVLHKANDVFKYLRTRRKRRLYQQWVDKADLAPEAVPPEEVAEDIIPKIDTKQLRLRMLYILVGFSLGILCMGLILLIVQSC